MKSKFYLAFILAGIVPVLGLGGFYLYESLENPTPTATSSAPAAVAVNTAQMQGEVTTLASSIMNGFNSTNADAGSLSAHHTEADLDTFVHSHNGVSGVALIDPTGKAVRTQPSSPALVDANYGSSAEFAKIQDKFKANPSANYPFFSTRLGYASFIFASPLPSGYFAEVVLNLSQFFKGASSNGQYFIIEANSGQTLYSNTGSGFNAQGESWLNEAKTDLAASKAGVVTGPGMGAAYAPIGLAKFGVVHVFNLTTASAGKASPAVAAKADVTETLQSPMVLGFVVAIALLCIGAAIASRILTAPFGRAVNIILATAEDPVTLTPDVVKSFGNDEAGRLIQAMNLLVEKFNERSNATSRSLNDQVSGLQRQSRQYQVDAQEKTQQLGDKMKELDALKGMAEGLRNQSEQARNEVNRLKSDLALAQSVQTEFTALQGRFTQLQTQLKNAEAKAAQALAQASTVQVSQVRAAAIRTMAEELKNTLGIIKGYVSSVIGAGQGGINEKQQEFLGMVINRSARLEKFINDLVDMYQVEIEQKDAKVDMVDLPKEIETLAFNFQTQTELKSLKFKVDAKPGLPKVPVVKRRLTQLWNVLYLQLIKDAPKGTTIPIVVDTVGDTVRVTLHDPGLTVTAEGLPKLFDEFYDPKHPASPQLAGTGLKMSLVKTILTAHGGSARAEKAEPGTRLVLTFATKRGEAGALPATTPAATLPPMGNLPPLGAAPKPAGTPAATPATGTPAAKPPVDLTAAFGVAPKPVAPAPTTPSAAPAAAAVPPKPASNPLDALLGGKIPSVTAPGLKPATPAAPTAAPTPTPPAAAPMAPPPGLTVGAKPPAVAAPGTPATPIAPPPGLTVGAKPPTVAAPATPAAPIAPPAGLTVGAKPPSAGPVGTPVAPMAPPAGLTVGAKPPAGAPSTGAPSIAPPPGFSSGSKIPGMDSGPAPTAPIAPPAGLTVGAKPPSAGPTPAGAAPAPGVPPAAPKAPVPGAPPVPPTAKPPVPGAPSMPPMGAPKPPAPAPAAPSAPSVPPVGAPTAPGAPKPAMPPSLDSLLNKPGAPPAGAPKPPSAPNIQGTKPPMPPSQAGDDMLE